VTEFEETASTTEARSTRLTWEMPRDQVELTCVQVDHV